ncbi:MAG: monovalent cation:proton antiporter-2 (CPA2) family protein [Gammaproteobacteria bacterium]|nr:monovalent cation:proton antiporter-2 (CPA2) family protein [Gammaproteobacteria bacterium]MBU1624869.1 monovalent cation:proton antiporter-2 (CPA2) family protein [Gammaproteobacteria bacterium]MBU1982713.1 monovalent cation:proton antiporter-2 (CPA2) family protein [Gammaproteobacteria bacterium]
MNNSLQLLLILLAVAVLVVVLFRSLHLPAMLGYLIVGVLIGPNALGWIPDAPETRHLAEFGVVFLMFSIGLEFSLARLRSMQRLVFGLGTAQVVATMLLVMMTSLFFDLGWAAGLALGGIMAMSSTAIVSKMLVERGELNTPHGQKIMGVLLFQDLAVVPLIILIPALSSNDGNLSATLAFAALKAVLVLTALLTFGQRLLRPWFHLVARQKSSELFMLNVLLFTLGLAWITELSGLSMALGAFVAGMLISETEYRYQVEEDIKPFRDVLLGLFFVTIGMMLDIHTVIDGWGWILLLLLILLPFKALVVALLVRAFSGDWGPALRTGLGLAQAGEFGFVLLTLTGGANLLPHDVMQNVLAAMLISMLIAPFMIQHAEAIVRRISPEEWMNSAVQMHQIAVQSMSTNQHVIICGYGRSGQALAVFLKNENVSFIALDLDSRRVHEASSSGERVVYGDAGKHEVLQAAGLMRAKALVITYDDKHSALRILRHIQQNRPDLPVIVRTADDSNVEILKKAGATEVVAEVLEGSVMLASQALLMAGIPLSRVVRRVQEARAKRYSMFSGYLRGNREEATDETDSVQPRFQSVMLHEKDRAVGMRLGDLKLAELNIEVNGVRRHNLLGGEPSDDMLLRAGDVLLLLGQPMMLEAAEKRLRKD